MSWDTVPGRNGEGYPDPTASTALARVQHSQKGLQSKRAGEHFENMITASLNWYCDKGVAFVEKNSGAMKPLRKPDRQGRFLACYTKAGQPDFKGTLAAAGPWYLRQSTPTATRSTRAASPLSRWKA